MSTDGGHTEQGMKMLILGVGARLTAPQGNSSPQSHPADFGRVMIPKEHLPP